MNSKITLLRYVGSIILVATSVLVLFQNCAPMGIEGNPILDAKIQPGGSQNSIQVDTDEKLLGKSFAGNEILNICGDAPDFPEDAVCAAWYSITLNSDIQISVSADGTSFTGEGGCFTFSGSYELSNSSAYYDQKNVLVVPGRVSISSIVAKAPACSPQDSNKEFSHINSLANAVGIAFPQDGVIGIDAGGGRLLLGNVQ